MGQSASNDRGKGRKSGRRRAGGKGDNEGQRAAAHAHGGQEAHADGLSPEDIVVFEAAKRDLRDRYEIDMTSELGHGHYGVVRKCSDRKTHKVFAIKSIKKSKVNRMKSLRREVEILRCVDHPNIIKLVDVFEDERYLHLVMELCTGGELFDRIIQKTESEEGHYSERDAARLVANILSGIEYCHNEHNICHRDLKPENFLLHSPDSEDDIKIIDFGLSRIEDLNSAMTTRVGTPYYIAPEVLSRKYDKACDLWSIGVITYILLSGYPPFYGDTDQEIFQSVRTGEFDFPSPEWDGISPEAKDFIAKLLRKEPTERITASQALVHPWFEKALEGGPTAKASLGLRHINHRLRRFVGMNLLKRFALNVIADQLGDSEMGHLRKVFDRLDDDGNGVISAEELEKVIEEEGITSLRGEMQRLLEALDIDGSQTLDKKEFLAATMERRIFSREENVKRAFNYFDISGTGVITKADLIKIFDTEERVKSILGAVDANDDGVIEYAEFHNMMLSTAVEGAPT